MPVEDAFRLVDESHAELLDDRRTLQAVERALRDLDPATVSETAVGTGSGRGNTFIGPLAGGLGIRPATLRKWERAGLVRPHRDALTGYRVYDEAAVRDARLTRQLRRGGCPLEQIVPLIGQVREAGGPEPLEDALTGGVGSRPAAGRCRPEPRSWRRTSASADEGSVADRAGQGRFPCGPPVGQRLQKWRGRRTTWTKKSSI